MSTPLLLLRLDPTHLPLARVLFALMVEVFDEGPATPLGDAWLHRLLSRPDFFAIAALQDGQPVGGITGHALPMTRDESTELFIYDLAVHPAHQRRGIGRALVDALRREAAANGIRVAFVPADLEDDHALAFYRAIGGAESPVRFFTFE